MSLRALQFELVAQGRGLRGAWKCVLDDRFPRAGGTLGGGLIETCVNWPSRMGEFPTGAELDSVQLAAHKVLYLARAALAAGAAQFAANGQPFDLTAPGLLLALLADCPPGVTLPNAAGGFSTVDRDAFLALAGAAVRARFLTLSLLESHAAASANLEDLYQYDYANPPPFVTQ